MSEPAKPYTKPAIVARTLLTPAQERAVREAFAREWDPAPPIGGDWALALRVLVSGYCPWCGHVIVAPVSNRDGVTWACLDGCNP